VELRLIPADPSPECLCGARGYMPLPLNGQRPFLWVGESPGHDWKVAVDHRKSQHPNHAGASQDFSVVLAHFRTAWFRALVVAVVLALLAAFGARQKLPSRAALELPPLRTGSGNAEALVIIRAGGAQA